MTHINYKSLDTGYTCICGKVTKTLAEANEHSKYFDNAPNAIKLTEALRKI